MRWLAAIVLVFAFAAGVQAASIEARLIRASNESDKSDEQLTKLVPKLKKVFGYQQYTQLGIQTAPLKENEQLRLDIGEGIVVLITPKGEDKKGGLLDVEMYSGRAALVKSDVRTLPNHHVLVRGPEVGSSLLIVSLTVVE